MEEQIVEFFRNGENNMKIWNGDQIVFPVFNPRFPLGILALGTMTVSAGVIAYANMPACIAFINMTAQGSGTASLQGTERTLQICIGLIMFFKFNPEPVNYFCQFVNRPHCFLYNLSNGLNRFVRLGFAT